MIWIVLSLIVIGGAGYFFWSRRTLALSVGTVLKRTAELLSLKEVRFKKYPMPTVSGDYFGYRIALEGPSKKKHRFLATLLLPKPCATRLFLQSEKRKTSLKPIADLKWITTGDPRFDSHFLLLAGEAPIAQAIFQAYLCGKILELSSKNWQIDIFKNEAHVELEQEILDAASLAETLKVIVEICNAAVVKSS